MSKAYLAHVKRIDHEWKIHHLDEHLRSVADLGGRFALPFGEKSSGWVRLAGLLHDLGKYSSDFQEMIAARSGYSLEAHLEGQPGKVNHSSAGAIHVRKMLGELGGKMLAYLIAGHHAGLPDWESNLKERLEDTPKNRALYQAALAADIPDDILNPRDWASALRMPDFLLPGSEGYQSMSISFWLRMLFSCLVDADFLDTEAFMDNGRSDLRAQQVSLVDLKASFDAYMLVKQKNSLPTPVNRIRNEVLAACLAKAEESPGIYTLTVPTGGGKTLTGLAYALQHALRHGQKRIIYVLPFTSILEQTAAVFREVFAGVGVDCVVEHHSSIESSRETVQSRLASENWDAPVILTTNVQFFESLFANRTSRCRKLHNIANSVVILDEAQQIPPEFKRPIEASLKLLAKDYKTTIVLSTATQPALDLGKTMELAPDPATLFTALKRVDIQVPDSLIEPVAWESLAEELAALPKVLCIVNRRDDAKKLFQLMPEGTYHLSALMCAAHRSQVISEIRRHLQKPEARVQVISTQLVEAGVDMDFPVVYRAMAGLDSIAQAAGRCNREGKMADLGLVKVFIPPSRPPIGLLSKAAQTSREMLHGQRNLAQNPQLFQQYFELFYASVNDHDAKGILPLLSPAENRPNFQFKEAALLFQLIDDSQDCTILIPYGDDGQAVEALAALERDGFSRGILRKLQRYTVSVPKAAASRMLAQGDLREVQPGLYQLKSDSLYHKDLGLDIGREVLLDTPSCII